MTIQRRTFLQSLGLGAGAFALSSAGLPPLARAQARPARNVVFCYFSGGWDTLLSLDTRDPSVFTEARVGETGIELAWDRLDADYRTPVMAQGAPWLAQGPDGRSPRTRTIKKPSWSAGTATRTVVSRRSAVVRAGIGVVLTTRPSSSSSTKLRQASFPTPPPCRSRCPVDRAACRAPIRTSPPWLLRYMPR